MGVIVALALFKDFQYFPKLINLLAKIIAGNPIYFVLFVMFILILSAKGDQISNNLIAIKHLQNLSFMVYV